MLVGDREKLIKDQESKLVTLSNRLLGLEVKGKIETSYYLSQLLEFAKGLRYYKNMVRRHEELVTKESEN
jgi:hypothetical protein